MLHFFRAGPELVHWELTVVEHSGPYRIALHHAHGQIVEYFPSSTMALARVHELEELLTRARGFVTEDEAVPA